MYNNWNFLTPEQIQYNNYLLDREKKITEQGQKYYDALKSSAELSNNENLAAFFIAINKLANESKNNSFNNNRY